MPYNPSTGIITAPVSIRDVQRCVPVSLRRTNTSTGQVETCSSSDIGVLCSAKAGDTIPASDGKGNWTVTGRIAIKMWAKFRPIEFKSSGRSGSSHIQQVPDTGTYSRQSVDYGICNIPVWDSRPIGNMLNFWSGYNRSGSSNPPHYYDENGAGQSTALPLEDYWKMVSPRTVFRITDFVSTADPTNKGYFHGAEPPIGNLEGNTINVDSMGRMYPRFAKNESGVSAGLTIKYEDLKLYNNVSPWNMYFGFALCKLNGSTPTNTWYFLTQGTSMSSFQEMGTTIYAWTDVANFEGSYQVFPFISSIQLTGDAHSRSSDYHKLLTSSNTNGNFIALLAPTTVNVAITYAQVAGSSLVLYTVAATKDRIINWDGDISCSEGNVTRQYTATISFRKSDGTEWFSHTVSGTVSYSGTFSGSLNTLSTHNVSPQNIASMVVTIVLVTSSDYPIVYKRTWYSNVINRQDFNQYIVQ